MTIKDRLPVILTKIIDAFCQQKSKIINTYDGVCDVAISLFHTCVS